MDLHPLSSMWIFILTWHGYSICLSSSLLSERPSKYRHLIMTTMVIIINNNFSHILPSGSLWNLFCRSYGLSVLWLMSSDQRLCSVSFCPPCRGTQPNWGRNCWSCPAQKAWSLTGRSSPRKPPPSWSRSYPIRMGRSRAAARTLTAARDSYEALALESLFRRCPPRPPHPCPFFLLPLFLLTWLPLILNRLFMAVKAWILSIFVCKNLIM